MYDLLQQISESSDAVKDLINRIIHISVQVSFTNLDQNYKIMFSDLLQLDYV